jgi:chromosome segregation ATPase
MSKIASQLSALQSELDAATRRQRKSTERISRLEDEKATLTSQLIALEREHSNLLTIVSTNESLTQDLEATTQLNVALSRKLERRAAKYRATTEGQKATIEKLQSLLYERDESIRAALQVQAEKEALELEAASLRAALARHSAPSTPARPRRSRSPTPRRSPDLDALRRENAALVAQAAVVDAWLSAARESTRDLLGKLSAAPLSARASALSGERDRLTAVRDRTHTFFSQSPPRAASLVAETARLRREIADQRRSNSALRRGA